MRAWSWICWLTEKHADRRLRKGEQFPEGKVSEDFRACKRCGRLRAVTHRKVAA